MNESELELRALDAFCAEFVMGLVKSHPSKMAATKGEFYIATQSKLVIVHLDNGPEDFVPTEDPAAAMQVLEKCIDKTKHTICLGWLSTGTRVVFLGGTYEKTKQDAPTLPLAIVRFAKALYSTK